MQTFTVEVDGVALTIVRDTDGKFVIPDAWRGIGSALKPANEPIVLARKPLGASTIAANILKWGVGGLNIDKCRVEADVSEMEGRSGRSTPNKIYGANINGGGVVDGTWTPDNSGRWPSNVILDGSEEVVGAFPETTSGLYKAGSAPKGERSIFGQHASGYVTSADTYGDSGSAARFFKQITPDCASRLFYSAKADHDDRLGSRHPTIKPVSLIQYLVRLVTPKGGLCLDLFAGSGTTGEACIREGMRCILVEREEEYQNDIRRRMQLAMAGSDERQRESIKAKHKDKPVDAGPLFGGNS